MAVRVFEGEAEDPGEWVFWRNDDDTKAPIRFRVRRVPAAVDRRLRVEHTRGVRAEKAGKRALSAVVEQVQEQIRDRAMYALMDSAGFAIIIGGPTAAEVYSSILGSPVTPQQEVSLDGRWTDDVRKHVLASMPALAEWLSRQANRLSGAEADEEEFLGEI